MLYPFVTVSVIYCYVIMLMAQIHDHFTAHASVCQEIGQGSAGTVRLCSTCCRLWGLGPQMASHSCFFHFYFSLSNLLIFSQSSFTASLIWNQYSNDYKNGIYSNLASEDWSICQSTRDNKSVMPEWGCIISIKDEIAVPVLVWAEICLTVYRALCEVCVCCVYTCTCVCMHVCPGAHEAWWACFPPSLIFSSCEGNLLDEIPGISVTLYLFCPGEVGWFIW